MNDFYTYAYIDETGLPYYIGKGRGERAWKTHGDIPRPSKDKILILKRGLLEEEAFRHERYIIYILGRVNLGTGLLLNKTAGGQGITGKVWTQSERERVRAEKLGSKWWNNGKENTQSKTCPGEGWKEGRLVTWDENKRLLAMSKSKSTAVYRLTHESGVTVYVKNLHKLGLLCGFNQAFYRILHGSRKTYKGWVSVEKVEEGEYVIDEETVINLCKKHDDKLYKITNKNGSVIFTDNLFELGRKFGTEDGFHRVYIGKRKSYKGWISVEKV
jgi:hypothetical protein